MAGHQLTGAQTTTDKLHVYPAELRLMRTPYRVKVLYGYTARENKKEISVSNFDPIIPYWLDVFILAAPNNISSHLLHK